jgi:tetratricopeptide (TPR) repeat protein
MLRVFSLQGRLAEASTLEVQLDRVLQQLDLSNQHRMSFLHGLAMLAFAKQDIPRGRSLLREVMRLSKDFDVLKYSRARNWMADSYLQEGRLDEAEQMFRDSLTDSLQLDYHRSITYCQVKLAAIAIARQDFVSAYELLNTSYSRAQSIQDERDIALILETFARLHTLRGDLPAGRAALAEAIDLFERLGMRRELIEAREELARLDTGPAPITALAEHSADADERSHPTSTTLIE